MFLKKRRKKRRRRKKRKKRKREKGEGEEEEEEKQTYLMFRDLCHTGLWQCTWLPLSIRPLLCIIEPVYLLLPVAMEMLGLLQSSIQCAPSFGSECF